MTEYVRQDQEYRPVALLALLSVAFTISLVPLAAYQPLSCRYVIPGGSAGRYEREGYTFDVGSSMMFGMGQQGTTNLITRALAAVGRTMETFPDPTQIHYRLPKSAAHPGVSPCTRRGGLKHDTVPTVIVRIALGWGRNLPSGTCAASCGAYTAISLTTNGEGFWASQILYERMMEWGHPRMACRLARSHVCAGVLNWVM